MFETKTFMAMTRLRLRWTIIRAKKRWVIRASTNHFIILVMGGGLKDPQLIPFAIAHFFLIATIVQIFLTFPTL